MIIETQISYGYVSLIQIFLNANNLIAEIKDMSAHPYGKVILEIEDDSETAVAITFMSIKHAGFENMLCDYLIKCGISPSLISIGKVAIQRNMDEVEKGWQEHRKTIGLA